LVISILALFVALGGSAYAATKIGTKDIKANAITAGKIKKNAVTTAKIKKEAVTGAKIKESSLGTVPSATNATNAVNATNAANWSRYLILGLKKASLGQTIALYSNGPFNFFGRCTDAGGGEPSAETFVTTNQPNSWMGSSEDNYYNADFNPGTEAQINYTVTSSTPETNQEYPTYYGEFSTLSPNADLRLLGNLWSAVSAFGSPCTFWGNVLVES
jgi:hypothetical protein